MLQDEDATPIDDDQPPLALMVGHEFKYALVADGAEEITFIVDSGSSHHIFRGRKDLMQDYVNLSTTVSTANNVNGLRAVGHGTLPILVTDVTGNEVRVDLKHVIHAPLCTHNLLSVARFTDMKMHVEFVGDTCTLHTPAGDQFEAERPQNLFELTARAVLSSEQAIALRVDDDVLSAAMALHQSLGYRHWKKVKEVLKAGGVPHLRPEVVAELLKLPTFTCKSCAHGKTTLRSLPKAAAPKSYQPFALVSMDHCGPFPVQFGGHTHLAVCVEQSERCGFIAPGHHPTGERPAEILAHLDNTARVTGNGIRTVRTDEGSDFTSRVFKQECADRGITRQLALKDAHGQNGVVERYLRTIQEGGVASLVASGAPQVLFFHAVLAFNFVDNRLLDSSGTCKLERLLGQPVPQVRFYTFACKVVSVMLGRSKMWG